MIEKLKKRNQELLDKNVKNEKEFNKYLAIKNILNVDNCFLKMDIANAYSILSDLKISKFKLKKTYLALINPKNDIFEDNIKYKD